MSGAVGKYRGVRVAALLGGPSSEREVSLASGRAMVDALRQRGYDVVEIDPGPEVAIQLAASGAGVVLNALHGTYGEDGRLQGLLDWLRLPYTGEGLRASVLAFDKGLAKARFRSAGLPVAEDVLWATESVALRGLKDLPFGLPVVVKPAAEGSSVGVSLVRAEGALRPAIDAAAACGEVLVERLIEGPELAVVTLGDAALGAVEIEPARDFYDYEAKYAATGTRYHLPPRLPEAVVREALRIGAGAHRALGCHGLTRTDLIVGPDGPVVLEVNTLPGMTGTSLVPKVAAAVGVEFSELVERILDLATFGLEGR